MGAFLLLYSNQKDIDVATQTQQVEDTFYSENLKKAVNEAKIKTQEFYSNKSAKSLSATDVESLYSEVENIYDSYRKDAQQKALNWKLNNGWTYADPKEVQTASSVSLMSISSQLHLTDEAVLYNASTAQYQFGANFNFDDISGWDNDGDLEDIMAIRTNKKSLTIKGYARTNKVTRAKCGPGETIVGTLPAVEEVESGYDNNGINSSTSKVNKRFGNDYGYVWNVLDGGSESLFTSMCKDSSGNIYGGKRQWQNTDNGRVTLYFKKAETGTSTAYLDYNHNYKTGITKATFTTTNLTSLGLNIEYGIKNISYPRTSTGRNY